MKKTEWKYNFGYITTWYLLSTLLSIYNKKLMGKDAVHLPLLMSAVHSGIHTVVSRSIIKYYKHKVKRYSRQEYFIKVVPCGIAAAIEICCGNASLVFITLSFYTMIKSSTPVWVLLFSFIFGFEKVKLRLLGVVGLIVFGVFLTIEGEPYFDMDGFILVLVASIASGLRWNMTQFLMKDKKPGEGDQSPLSTMYHLSPVMFITMFSLSLYFENPFKLKLSIIEFIFTLIVMSIGGILAFIMILAEFYLIKGTSTVTLSVAGISKEILVIGLSVLIYGDVLTFKTYLGLFISIIGIIGFNYFKYLEKSNLYPKPHIE